MANITIEHVVQFLIALATFIGAMKCIINVIKTATDSMSAPILEIKKDMSAIKTQMATKDEVKTLEKKIELLDQHVHYNRDGVRVSMRNDLISQCEKHIRNGYIPYSDLAILEKDYDTYSVGLKGDNKTVEKLHKEVLNLQNTKDNYA